jgi:group I intron endonuclease
MLNPRETLGVIYKVTNKITGKVVYIGQTTQVLKKRWIQHCNKKGCRILYNHIKKYGKENFIIEVVTECKFIEEMNYREVFYIKLFNTLDPNGYNILAGGKTFKHSEATKKLISISRVGFKHTEETKKKNSKASIEYWSNLENRVNQSLIWANKSEEDKVLLSQKLSDIQKIVQNRPDQKRKNSEAQKIAQNKPEKKTKNSESGKYGNHIRHHLNNNIINPDCKFCVGEKGGKLT